MNNLEYVRKPVHNKCFGMEIECILPYEEADKAQYKYHQFWYAGGDGSIITNGRGSGIEFVSQPLPYKALQKQIGFLGKKFNWIENASCGIHVHVGRQGVSEKRLRALYRSFGNLYEDEQRALFGRIENSYCRMSSWINSNPRYDAINFTNAHTIEFRMFRSGDANWAKECLRRVKLMVEFKGIPNYTNLLELFTRPETSN